MREVGEDLRAGGRVVGLRVARVAELVDHQPALSFRHLSRHLHGAPDTLVGGDLLNHGAVSIESPRDLRIDVLRHDDSHVVATRTADHGERNPRVAGRGLDDCAARQQEAVPLGVEHHLLNDAVLDATRRVCPLQLCEETNAWIWRAVLQLDQRGIAYGVDDVGVVHAGLSIEVGKQQRKGSDAALRVLAGDFGWPYTASEMKLPLSHALSRGEEQACP
jgi:hypothetical protein